MADVASIRKVFQYSNKIINPADASNYLAGGYIRNETLSGGGFFSPTKIYKLNEAESIDSNSKLLNGGILSYLGYGLGEINKQLNEYSNFGNTLNNEIIERRVISFTVTATDSNTGSVLYDNTRDITISSGDDSEEYDIDNLTDSLSTSSLNTISQTNGEQSINSSVYDTAQAWANKKDLLSLANATELDIAIYAYDVLTNETVSVEQRIQGAMLGTIQNLFKNKAIELVADLAGITQITPAVLLGANILGAIFDELTEMALGLDTQFGYGGDLMNISAKGIIGIGQLYAEIDGNFAERTLQQTVDALGEMWGAITGDGYTSASERSEYNTLGSAIDTIRATIDYSTPSLYGLKAIEEVQALESERDSVLSDMSEKDQGQALYDEYEKLGFEEEYRDGWDTTGGSSSDDDGWGEQDAHNEAMDPTGDADE